MSSRGHIAGQVVISIKMMVQVGNIEFGRSILKCEHAAPGLTPDQSA